MELRKIYLSGGSTYVVSLPKHWVESMGVGRGDSVAMEERGTSLIVEPMLKEIEVPPATIYVSEVNSPSSLQRVFVAHYLAGYEAIKVVLDTDDRQTYWDATKDIAASLIGAELMDETKDYLFFEVLFDYKKMPTLRALRRMHALCHSMLEEIRLAIEEEDVELALQTKSREVETDRLYFLVVRQLKVALQHHQLSEKLGIEHERDCLGYRVVVKSIERISDHLSYIAESYAQLVSSGRRGALKQYLPLFDMLEEVYSTSLDAILDKEYGQLNTMFSIADGLESAIKDHFNALFNETSTEEALLKKSVLDAISRVMSQSLGIAEIGINYSVRMP